MDDRGTFRAYIDKKFSAQSLALIDKANAIIASYEREGYSLTLRQLYYQFVARDLLPNNVGSYNKLGSVISDARLAGLVSWTAIEDRGRNLRGVNTFNSPGEALREAQRGYRIDLWRDQEWRPEVWIEKEALVGVIQSICAQHRVDFFACRGYNSQSEQWRAGRRFAGYIQRGQRPIVFHLGDHDPSGIDMTRDNRERLSMFAGVNIIVERLALNRDQIDRYRPPPNPAKATDSRFAEYQAEHGDESWELDALEPRVINDLIGAAINRIKDQQKWDEALLREAQECELIDHAIEELG